MAPSDSGLYKRVGEIEKDVAVIKNEQTHFVGAVEGLSMTVKDLRDTVSGLKIKVGIIIGIASIASSVVTNVLSELFTKK